MLYIIRHGQTKLNKSGVLQGMSNYPLNEQGMEQARRLGEWFSLCGINFDMVFSSPLTRAMQTAGLVAPGCRIQPDRRLIEMDYGPYEGVNLKSPPEEIRRFFRDFKHQSAPEGMEQLSEVVKRAGEFVERIRDISGNILVSTHAIAMKGILEYLTPDSGGSYWSTFIGNCAVYTAENENGLISIPKELLINNSLNSAS